MKLFQIVLGSLLLLATLMFAAFRYRSPTPADGSNPQGVERVPATTSQDERVIAAVARIEQRLELLEAKAAAPPPDVHAKAAPDPELDQESYPTSESLRDRESQRVAEIQRRLRTEPRDRPWAATTEVEIQNVAKSASVEGKNYSLKNLSCLTSICTAEVTATGTEGPFEITHVFPLKLEGIAAVEFEQAHIATDGSYTVPFKFYRKGYPLPGQE